MLIRPTVFSPIMMRCSASVVAVGRQSSAATFHTCRAPAAATTTTPSSTRRAALSVYSPKVALSSTSATASFPSLLLRHYWQTQIQLQQHSTCNHARMTTAMLTTQSHCGSRTLAASSSLRSLSLLRKQHQQQQQHSSKTVVPPFFIVPGQHAHSLGAMSYFSSSSGGGGGGGAPGKGMPKGGRGGMAAGIVGAGMLLLGKGKYLIGALKVTKLSSLASMLISIGAYSMIFGVPYACGIVGLIFVHECGHALVMHHYKIPFSPMVFLPFMGAVIAMKDLPRDAWQDAIIAFGGPVMGTVGAGAVAVGAQMTDSQLLYALADFGFMVNLFNMMPIGDMDGGRITGALSPYFGVAGLAGGAGLIYAGAISNPIFYLVMLAGGWSTFQRLYDPVGHRPPHYYNITSTQRGILGTAYFGLIGVLIAGMSVNAINKKSPEEITRYQELSFDERKF